MGMQNFAPEFETPEQYIIDITYIIWEEANVGRIRDWYAPVCPIRSPHGVMNSAEEILDETLEQMHVFAERKPLADDVIIGDKPSGFYSSHRVRSVGRHTGDSELGPATDRAYQGLGIADCLCRDNQVVEEWKLRDQGSFLMQLGIDPVAHGLSLGVNNSEAYAIGNEAMRQRWADENGLTIAGDHTIANRILHTCDALWNGKHLNTVAEQYVAAARFEGPSGHLSYGREPISDMIASITAALPDGRFEPHHLIVRQQNERAVRVAMRWTFCGTHSGHGRYGAPTNAPVAILGISHFELHDGLIASEWMVVDETAIYAQIAAYQATQD